MAPRMRQFLKWIYNERAWLFSGAGFVVLGLIGTAANFVFSFSHIVSSNTSAPPSSLPYVPSYSNQTAAPGMLENQSWVFDFQGKSILIYFGPPPSFNASLSSHIFGTGSKWTEDGPYAFSIRTDTYYIIGWFILNGDGKISHCDGYAAALDGTGKFDLETCRPASFVEKIGAMF